MTQEESKLKILLCEDDESLGMLLREYLQAKGKKFFRLPLLCQKSALQRLRRCVFTCGKNWIATI